MNTKHQVTRALNCLRLEAPDAVVTDVSAIVMAHIAKLEEALIWCSGSPDFGEGGQAREGWLKLCKPLLDNLTPAGPTGSADRG